MRIHKRAIGKSKPQIQYHLVKCCIQTLWRPLVVFIFPHVHCQIICGFGHHSFRIWLSTLCMDVHTVIWNCIHQYINALKYAAYLRFMFTLSPFQKLYGPSPHFFSAFEMELAPCRHRFPLSFVLSDMPTNCTKKKGPHVFLRSYRRQEPTQRPVCSVITTPLLTFSIMHSPALEQHGGDSLQSVSIWFKALWLPGSTLMLVCWAQWGEKALL